MKIITIFASGLTILSMTIQEQLNKKKRVKYTKEYNMSDGIKLPEYGRKDVNTDFIKSYIGAMGLLFELSGCSRNLLDFLSYKMERDTNIIRIDSYTKDEFNGLFEDGGYSDSAINKAIAELSGKRFIIKERRGVYMVNPEFIDRGGGDKRLEKIQVALEFESGVRTKISVNHRFSGD